jgi:hypothetical protein
MSLTQPELTVLHAVKNFRQNRVAPEKAFELVTSVYTNSKTTAYFRHAVMYVFWITLQQVESEVKPLQTKIKRMLEEQYKIEGREFLSAPDTRQLMDELRQNGLNWLT